MTKEHFWNVPSGFQGLTQVGLLLLGCFGISAARPSWGQASMPPDADRQETATALPDPFFNALEGLSKKYGVAFVAEGRPFPQAKSRPLQGNAPVPNNGEDPALEEAARDPDPAPLKDLSLDEAVQKVADRFDYTAVHQGNIYLLQKRYTNPDDLPETTPEECRVWLR